MREIKFKFWNGFQMIENKDIAYIDFNNKFVSIWDKYSYDYLQIDFNENNKLMMFTGIKDIEGNEIYEGDIVHRLIYKENKVLVGEVKMLEGMWAIINEKEKVVEPLWGEADVNKIIGNIFEDKKTQCVMQEVNYD